MYLGVVIGHQNRYLEIRRQPRETRGKYLLGIRVGIVWLREYPWDVRIEKFVQTIKKEGGEPHIICRNWRCEKKDEIVDGIEIHRLPYFTKLPAKTNRLLTSRFPFSPVWLIRIRQIITRQKLNCLIIRDLPLAPTAIAAAIKINIPIIFDMAENYPAFLRVRYKRVWYFHVYPWLANRVERIVLKYIDRVFVVARENYERIRRLGFCGENMSIVSNTPYLSMTKKSTGVSFTLGNRFRSHFVILYVGFFDSHRGIDVAIRSLPYVLKEIPNAMLVLVGVGSNENILKKLSVDLYLTKNILFEGFVENQCVSGYIEMAEICIIPHLKNEHIETTLPNKLFDYMAHGKCVLASSAKPLARVIREEKCGLIFNAGSSEDMAQCIIRLKDSRLRTLLGKRGRIAILTKYNWECDSRLLIQAIKSSKLQHCSRNRKEKNNSHRIVAKV